MTLLAQHPIGSEYLDRPKTLSLIFTLLDRDNSAIGLNLSMRVNLSIIKKLELFLYVNFSRLHQLKAKRVLKNSEQSNEKINKLDLLHYLPENPNIVEIGCHVGIDTLELSILFPRGDIYAFEPHPSLFNQCWNRTRVRRNVKIWQQALSDSAGPQIFYSSSGESTGSGSLLKPALHLVNHPKVKFDPEERLVVFTSTLDLWARMINLSNIDLLWIDVQGAELLVLRGGREILRHTSYIYIEVSERPLYEGGVPYTKLKNFMSEVGFVLKQEFIPNSKVGEGNVLFERIR